MKKKTIDSQVKALIVDIKDTLQTIADTGTAECRLCGFKVTGSDYGEIFEKLGKHAEEAHGNQFLLA